MADIKRILNGISHLDTYQRVDSTHPLDLYIGIDDTASWTLLLISDVQPYNVASSKMILVRSGKRQDGKWTQSFSLKDEKYKEMFILFCEDISISSAKISNKDKAVRFVGKRYKEWREMLANARGDLLSPEEIKGLLGEMFFLHDFLMPLYGAAKAALSWTGPRKLPQDFIVDDTWYEVKTVSSARNIVNISSVEQLDSTKTGELIVIRADKTSLTNTNAVNLNVLYRKLLSAILGDDEKEVFANLLLRYGYYPRPEYESEEYTFEIESQERYDVIVNDKDRANGLKDIYVPMKLSVVTPEKAMELIPNIAKYANKQNKVSDADFFSNHAFHVRIEDFSRRVLAPAVMGNQYGTHWYYERTRGQYKQEQSHMTKSEQDKFLIQNPKAQMFTKTDLAKLYNIYRQIPHQVSAGAQKNFIQFAEWASTAWEKDETVFNERFFRQIVCLNILYKKLDYIVKHASWYEMGYKAQVVTYALAYLFFQISKECPDRVLDFKSIWSQQGVTHNVEMELEKIAEAMYNHLVSPSREVQNVTEWAKRETCWKKAKEIGLPLSAAFKSELVSATDDADAQKRARKEQKQDNNVSAMVQVANYGVQKWKAVLAWGIQNRVFTPQEISFLKAAVAMETGKFPSEKQCVRIMQVLEKAREESYPE